MSSLPGPLLSWLNDRSAKEVLGVWMRDVLGMSNNLEGIWQSMWIGWLGASMGKLRLSGQAATHNLVR